LEAIISLLYYSSTFSSVKQVYLHSAHSAYNADKQASDERS